jgi:outer membrane biosynthesis protein TonB
VKDDEFTNYQNRKESRTGGVIKGSYSVVDSDGFIRTVSYTADPKEGFKAEVVREPTDIVIKFPTPAPQTQQQQPQQQIYRQAPAKQQQQQYAQNQAPQARPQQQQQQQQQQYRPEYYQQ